MAKFNRKGLIIAALRKIWLYSPERKEVREAARGGKDSYRCAKCTKFFPRKETCVDHIHPVVSPTEKPGTGEWDWVMSYCKGLFVPEKEMQVLCKECHNAKSQDENTQRRKLKLGAKP